MLFQNISSEQITAYSHSVSSKVKFTLRPAMKAQMGKKWYGYSYFNISARWGWMVNTMPWLLHPWEWPSTHCVEGWVSHRAGLEGCGKSTPMGIWSPDHPAHSDDAIPAYRLSSTEGQGPWQSNVWHISHCPNKHTKIQASKGSSDAHHLSHAINLLAPELFF